MVETDPVSVFKTRYGLQVGAVGKKLGWSSSGRVGRVLRSHGQCRLADVLAIRSVVGCPLEELVDLIAGSAWRGER